MTIAEVVVPLAIRKNPDLRVVQDMLEVWPTSPF